jgi:hypothetical protein
METSEDWSPQRIELRSGYLAGEPEKWSELEEGRESKGAGEKWL